MRLERMGSSFQTRLSFMRALLRRMGRENWRLGLARADLDDDGFGTAVYEANTGTRVYSLVAFSRALAPEKRTDRVIAEEWDASFALFDGRPSEADIARLADNVPRQEAGRFQPSEIVLCRANKSLRLFEHVVERLAEGRQPDLTTLAGVGYLMRTTAVYGNGKFGIADRDKIAGRPELAGPYQAEMLAVYLVRAFTLDLVEHVARRRAPERAVALDPRLRRFLGIGNATGLGMAPFLHSHPILIHNWFLARETALARVRALSHASAEVEASFRALLARARQHASQWRVADPIQAARIGQLEADLAALAVGLDDKRSWLSRERPWDSLYRWAESTLSLEGQEALVSLMLEPYPELVDELAETMAAEDGSRLDPTMTVARLRDIVALDYAWARSLDFAQPDRQRKFWYMSEEKLEPRLGDRYAEPGAERELPLAVARDLQALALALGQADPRATAAALALARPDLRHILRRVQTVARHPYGEIRDNLVDAAVRPIDLLRCKLAFFGAAKFDPRSDLWTRITMYQGAPLPDELGRVGADDWNFAVTPDLST
jgi:hypothetical protein